MLISFFLTLKREKLPVSIGELFSLLECLNRGLVFSNIDETNFVEIGIDDGGTFHSFAKLKPGEQGTIRLSTTAPYARSDTAATDLFYIIYED